MSIHTENFKSNMHNDVGYFMTDGICWYGAFNDS